MRKYEFLLDDTELREMDLKGGCGGNIGEIVEKERTLLNRVNRIESAMGIIDGEIGRSGDFCLVEQLFSAGDLMRLEKGSLLEELAVRGRKVREYNLTGEGEREMGREEVKPRVVMPKDFAGVYSVLAEMVQDHFEVLPVLEYIDKKCLALRAMDLYRRVGGLDLGGSN